MRDSIKILSTRIDNITLNDAVSIISGFLTDSNSPHQIITANSLMVLQAQKDEELKKIFETASVIIPESSGICWASKFLGTPLKQKIPGIDFMMRLLDYAQNHNHSVFFLGAKEKIIQTAVEKIKKKLPNLKITGFHNGYFFQNEPKIISEIKTTQSDILFVGLNIPFQEKWIHKNLEQLGVKIAIGIGGSFDVLSGKLKRAPRWMINTGTEWLFRTIQQPWRVVRILKLLLFVSKIFKARLKSNY
ncbi:MAG: WecB/TagA/CpsF family glycosyltransferase [Elusimicrobiota bacterium]